MNDITLYHNPRCSTSRKALDLLRAHGVEPRIVEYLKTPPGREDLAVLAQALAASGQGVRDLLRAKQPEYAEQGLDNPALADARLLDALAGTPALLNRPVVLHGSRACVARPVERLLDLLD